MATRARARRIKCPFCEKDVSIKTDGTVRPHINFNDQARIGNCPYSGMIAGEDLRPFNAQNQESR